MTRTLRSSGPVAVDVSSYLEEDEDVDGDRQVEEVEEEEGEPSIEWKCDVATCGKIFHRKSRLARHRVTHIGLRLHKCPTCGKDYSRREHLTRHLLSHAATEEDKKPFACPVENCGARYSTKQHLRRHEIIHERELPYVCQFPDCDAAFAKHGQLRKHMGEHTGKLPYPCPEAGCEKSFPTPSKLKLHQQTHSDADRYHCGHGHCNAVFKRWSDLQKHMSADHADIECPICAKSFKRKDVMKAHIKTHDPSHIPNVPCSYEGCSKLFMSAKSMQVHVKAFHLNERPFACDKCDSKFAHKHLLARHKRLHDNPQPVAKKARKDAFVPPTLFESITGDRPGPRNFACQFPDCSLSYKRAYDLDRHYKAVHSKEMQQSEYLDSSFDPLGCTTPPLLLPLNAMELYPPSSLVSPTHIMDQNLLIAGDMISPSPSPPPELMESEDLLILSASSSDMTYSKASEFPGYGVPNGMIRAADSEYIPSQGTFGYLIDPLLMDPSARS